ncbi:hypothetical protein E2C01_032098 [Portunus trituberculatus]|uniref:Uncharacterized protein n=1 Tax=Portunus trituberculatus TaxID=210409 RepID=A0A5B7F013_PORTR|nr:hypothetical protein [Portunus trituberculatus]
MSYVSVKHGCLSIDIKEENIVIPNYSVFRYDKGRAGNSTVSLREVSGVTTPTLSAAEEWSAAVAVSFSLRLPPIPRDTFKRGVSGLLVN